MSRRRLLGPILCAVAVASLGPEAVAGGAREASHTPSAPKARRAADAPSAPITPENGTAPPLTSDELTDEARRLFDGIVRDEPELADAFFFPREPFLRLKDVADPAKYHVELVRAYRRDVHLLHAHRRSWEGARFVSFELGTPPRWVKPGDEWNKIGYHRTFDAKLRYEIAGKAHTLDVHTIISWDGRWYVTHLLPTKR